MSETFLAPISERIWREKYRLSGVDGAGETCPLQMFDRVARTAAEAEPPPVREAWRDAFFELICDYRFLPAGRILAGAGAGRRVTLFNCFVMGTIPDSLDGIFSSLKESALTLQTGGGIGLDFSTLRPRGALVTSIGADASGPVSFMEVWDAMCRTIMSAGARRGAMMATMRADHPDIDAFIAAKAEPGRLTNFNLSVLVPDALMAAVASDAPWSLRFGGKEFRRVRARDLWLRIMRSTFETSEPGVIFIDRVNAENNLSYCETIHTTNPCGEQPLPPYGACLLGSFNLARYVKAPFSDEVTFDEAALRHDVHLAVRLLDNLIDGSHYPLAAQESEAKAKRRMGLGVTGLADALVFLGQRYDEEAARATARGWMALIQSEAYAATAELAREKGAFPLCDRQALERSPNVARLPRRVRDAVAAHGLRNGCLTSIAPTGTISLLAGNVSSGIEPIFDVSYERTLLGGRDSEAETLAVEDYAYATFRRVKGPDAPLPDTFVTASDLAPDAHLAMQAALQSCVDSSISKTINMPESSSFDDVAGIYAKAHALGLKGCTTYRPSALRGAVLKSPASTQVPLAQVPPGRPEDQQIPRGTLAVEIPASGVIGTATPAGSSRAAQRLPTDSMPPASLRSTPPPSARLTTPPPAPSRDGVVYMSEPLARHRALSGVTYKLKWPDSADAIYVTLNDIEVDGRRRPFEIFINTRNLEHYTWTVALTRMISAVFRRGGDVSFVAEELKVIFDPQGGRWIEGRYVPSLIAAIGNIIDEHLEAIGFHRTRRAAGMKSAADPGPLTLPSALEHAGASQVDERSAASGGQEQPTALGHFGELSAGLSGQSDESGQPAGRLSLGTACPVCGAYGLERREGCWICGRCGFSKCD